MTNRPVLAVVIPALNEAEYLPELLDDLGRLRIPAEVVVVDGGSTDGTFDVAAAGGARIVSSGPGRAGQMRAGADATSAPWLFFIHADCRISESSLRTLEEFIAPDDRSRHGHFAFALAGEGWYWRFIEFSVRVREAMANLVYGDQGLLVSRQAYREAGGHPLWPIMEDVGVLDRLRNKGTETRLDGTLVTSPRRYEVEGRIRTWLRHGMLMALFRMGVSPRRLARWRAGDDGVPRRSLIVFAKAPRPGKVKTRLAADVGADEATRIYRSMGRQIVDAVRGGRYSVRIHHDPPEAAHEVAAWLGARSLSFHAQTAGDLGARMADAFEQCFGEADEVCIIGTDAPSVSRETIDEAFDGLATSDLVIGPAEDGGYYLLALRRPCPALFDGIAWSSPEVLDATLARANEAGFSVHQLARQTDVDTLADVPPHLLAT